jgi:hypothetical protein
MPTSLFNIPWLNANASRNYPLEDAAGKRDDLGAELPDDIITDINIWFPDSLGLTAFVSSVSITPNMVSVTICAHDSRIFQAAGTAGKFTPLAAISIPKPVDRYRNYQLSGFQTGVGGWISFGPGIDADTAKSFRFSSPSQTALLPRVVKTYSSSTGVTTIGKYGYATRLNGIIKFLSQNSQILKIEKDKVRIDGVIRDAVVFRLNQEESGRTVFERFLGPCDGRPESTTCDNPPIHAINNVIPYCDGTIKVYLTELTLDGVTGTVLSYAKLGTNPNIGVNEGDTVAIDYNTGMSDVCEPKSSSINNDKIDHCDDGCDDWESKGEGASPLPDICFVWYTGRVAEPTPAFGGTVNTYVRYSSEFAVDVTGLAPSTPLFTIMGASDDFLMLLKSSETVDINIISDVVNIDIPPTAILIKDNVGCIVASECDDGLTAHGPTTAKRVRNKSNLSQTYFFPAGTTLARCRGNGHVADITGLPNSKQAFNHTFTVGDFNSSWIDGGNILRLKCCHVVAGWGFANVEFQCAAGLHGPP